MVIAKFIVHVCHYKTSSHCLVKYNDAWGFVMAFLFSSQYSSNFSSLYEKLKLDKSMWMIPPTRFLGIVHKLEETMIKDY